MTQFEALRRYPLFALPPPSLIRFWLEQGQCVRVKAGETIFQQGSPGVWAYLIRQGRVRVVRNAPSGREVSLGLLKAAELFGDYALLPPELNTATCRAVSDVELWQFPLGPVREWANQTPAVRGSLKSWLQLHFLVRHLRKQAFLGFMSATSALAMQAHLDPLEVPALRTVQAEGLGEDRWFFLEEGEVVLDEGEAVGRTLGAGSFLGEQALAGSRELPMAVALTPVRCLSLPREFFLQPELSAGSRQSTLASVQEPLPAGVCWVGQREAADCGAAALAMIAYYFGLPIDAEAVRAQVPVGPRGTSLLDLLGAARRLALGSEAVRITRQQLGYVHVPAIAYLSPGHYVVLFRLDHSGILMGDPASGVVKISFSHFLEHFTGHLLLFHLAESRGAGLLPS